MASDPNQVSYEVDRRTTILETRFDTILPTLATKADLSDLRVELKSDLHREIGGLTRWLVALTVSMLFGFAGIIVTMISLLRH